MARAIVSANAGNSEVVLDSLVFTDLQNHKDQTVGKEHEQHT